MTDWPKDSSGRNVPLGKLPKVVRMALAKEAIARIEPFLKSPQLAAFIRAEIMHVAPVAGVVDREYEKTARIGLQFETGVTNFQRAMACPLSVPMTQSRALEILTVLQRRHGKAYKINIRQAWESGDYSTFPEFAQELQWIRNAWGNKWLSKNKGAHNTNTRAGLRGK